MAKAYAPYSAVYLFTEMATGYPPGIAIGILSPHLVKWSLCHAGIYLPRFVLEIRPHRGIIKQ